MKKAFLSFFILIACLSLASCGNTQSKSNKSSEDVSESREAHSLEKANAKLKQKIKKQSSSSSANSSAVNSEVATQESSQKQPSTTQQSSNTGKSQSEINRERGYDPNGNPLLPGQDHAAGSNPDGSPDAWVQSQIDWAIQNGYMNPDGTNTPKGQAAEDEVERDSQPGMP